MFIAFPCYSYKLMTYVVTFSFLLRRKLGLVIQTIEPHGRVDCDDVLHVEGRSDPGDSMVSV